MSNLRHLRVSAPGKIILHGEHAVVYQKTAVALSLGLRTRLDLTETTDGRISIIMDKFLQHTSWSVEELSKIIDKVKIDANNPETELDQELVEDLRMMTSGHHYQNGDGPAVGNPQAYSTQSVALVGFLYILVKLCKFSGKQRPPSIQISISSDIAISAGLGSSAAFAVCLSASLLSYLGIIVCDRKNCADVDGKLVPSADQLALINHWAFMVEKIVHGSASGVDNAVSTYGGSIKYRNNELTRIGSGLKLDVLIVDTHVQRDTKKMLDIVRHRRKLYPAITNPVLEAIDGISETSSKILQHGDGLPTGEEYEVIADLVRMNQNLLSTLGVSHPKLDVICETASRFGQAGKLTGAGGGGCAIVVLDPDMRQFEHLRESIIAEYRRMEFKPHLAELGGPGVLFHPVP
ncbi:hypothetical protein RvY_15762 [Ramazzottius varieornatus]|uniref:Mevalonate kinase n=1 Tax=Ramazzottius varieornatus TaxID=947166 RepID=A0A1D1VW28_RAMVA|nr:hypothetical protein RvY_15762 [Ramazzottius varieornatus]